MNNPHPAVKSSRAFPPSGGGKFPQPRCPHLLAARSAAARKTARQAVRRGVMVVSLCGPLALAASAGTVVWQGVSSPDWGDPRQWQPEQVPDDVAQIVIRPHFPDLMGGSYTINY